ncbi:MAG: putative Ig domain-containing protein [Propionibacteriaceae bacterium]|nr:putative Ig domain-containing protein [Propionibacteriaceae bacterium]
MRAALAMMLVAVGLVGTSVPAWALTSGLAIDTRFSELPSDGAPTPLPPYVQAIAKGDAGWLIGGSQVLMLLNDDGSPNTAFNDNLGSGLGGGLPTVTTVASDGDGWLVGGQFSSLNGVPVQNFFRLNADGTLDTSFTDNVGAAFTSYVLTIEPDGVGGWLVGGQFRIGGSHLVRLAADGTLDVAFSAAVGPRIPSGSHVNDTAGDGAGWLVGTFLQSSQNVPLFKFDSTGALDEAFAANAVGSGFNGYVQSVARDTVGDGWLVGGTFTTANGVPAGRLLRLNADGTRDTAFDAQLGSGFINGSVQVVVPDGDGWLVGGSFFSLAGRPNTRALVRLHADGSLDTGFAQGLGNGPDGTVRDAVAEGSGRILLGGSFGSIDGHARNGLAALVPAVVAIAPVADRANLVGQSVSIFVPASATTTQWGSLPFTFAATGLPAGLSINTDTGQITGTPTTTGISTVTVSATSTLVTDSRTFTWTINQAPTLTGAPADGTVGTPFSYTFTTTGVPPVSSVTLSAGSLPPGLTLSTAGVLSGTPTQAGTYTFTLEAENGTGVTAELDVELTIHPGVIDSTTIRLNADPASILADGITTSTITVSLTDPDDNPVPGADVGLTTTAGTLSDVTDNGDGTYTATLTSATTAGTALVEVTLDGTDTGVTTTVAFTAGGGSGSGSGSLPVTGSDAVLPILIIAALLIGLGAWILVARRRTQPDS